MALTRRNFVARAAAAAAAAGLAACNQGGTAPAPEPEPAAPASGSLEAPDLSSYPIDPDGADVAALWTATETSDGYSLINNGEGKELGISNTAKIIQVGGYAFKDLNGNGKLDVWEDWRQDTTTRATALANELDIRLALAQMISGSFRTADGGFEEELNVGDITADQKKDLDEGFTNRIKMTYTENIKEFLPWFNQVQAYAESVNVGIPVTFETETFQGMSSMAPLGLLWPSNPTIAATFDPQNAWEVANDLSIALRAFGATKPNSPQTDVGTQPDWDRNSDTWSEDPALARDMANKYISGMQSTYDDDGNDLGWGKHSLMCNMKHFPGDGAAQFGRDSHSNDGKFGIYPNGNNRTNWIPFLDGGLNLDSKTGQCGSAMPFYSIAYSNDGEYGELVGGGFSKYIMSIGRAAGFEGIYSSDWNILDQRPWGVEKLSNAEKLAKSYEAGMCLMIDDAAYDVLDEAYEIMKKNMGEAEAEARVRDSIMRIERSTMNLGLFENPFLNLAESKKCADPKLYADKMHEILVKGIVMLKNNDVVKQGGLGDKPKVYFPRRFSVASSSWFMSTSAGGSADLAVSEDILSKYFDVVTDTVGEPTGAPAESDGEGAAADPQPTLQESDIVRRTADELKDVKYAIMFVNAPDGGADTVDENGTMIPRTMQYRTFTADAASGCPETAFAEFPGEPMSPYGNSNTAGNESDLDFILNTKAVLPEDCKLIICVMMGTYCTMCFHEFEPIADCILIAQCNDNENFLEIITGKTEPSGLLPWQQPKDMAAIYAQATDTPRDMECYVDANGNSYDFGFGLNWSGVISDERTAKYCVPPILVPSTTIDESLLIR